MGQIHSLISFGLWQKKKKKYRKSDASIIKNTSFFFFFPLGKAASINALARNIPP